MKSYFVFAVLFLALSMLACQDSKEGVKIVDHDLDFYRSVGEEIPMETSVAWREYYRQQQSEQGRLALVSNSLTSSQLTALRESVDEIVGIAFHYGIDESGVTHIIAIPVNESLRLWTNIPGRIYIDTNTGEIIDSSVANTWAEAYKVAFPNNIWFHFFGESTFEEIVSIPYFEDLEIAPAINILNLKPQLLLIVWENISATGGRVQTESSRSYDASYPCPPCGIQ
jgi:hypothetical protein